MTDRQQPRGLLVKDFTFRRFRSYLCVEDRKWEVTVSKADHKRPESCRSQSVEKRPARRVRTQRDSLVAFFRRSPLAEAMAAGEIDLERDRDQIRDLNL
jgi:hypothetical protein